MPAFSRHPKDLLHPDEPKAGEKLELNSNFNPVLLRCVVVSVQEQQEVRMPVS